MTVCPTCRGYIYSYEGASAHRCPPAWQVWYPDWQGDDPEDAQVVYAHSAESAVEQWAHDCDAEGDYTIIGGSGVTVKVRALNTSDWDECAVDGETVAQYSARKVDKK